MLPTCLICRNDVESNQIRQYPCCQQLVCINCIYECSNLKHQDDGPKCPFCRHVFERENKLSELETIVDGIFYTCPLCKNGTLTRLRDPITTCTECEYSVCRSCHNFYPCLTCFYQCVHCIVNVLLIVLVLNVIVWLDPTWIGICNLFLFLCIMSICTIMIHFIPVARLWLTAFSRGIHMVSDRWW
jgi:uncharacterized protein (DUF983 family)